MRWTAWRVRGGDRTMDEDIHDEGMHTETTMPGAPEGAPATYAIGDVHGEAALLRALLARLPLRGEDTLVFLGDAIDRGPDSLGVARLILALAATRSGATVALMGNHEEAWLDRWDGEGYFLLGRVGVPGDEALIPQLRTRADHADLYRYLLMTRLTFEDEFAYYAHAGAAPAPGSPFDRTPPHDLLWGPAGFLSRPWRPRDWGAQDKPIIFGHYERELADIYGALGVADAAGLGRYLSGRADPSDPWAGAPPPVKLGIDTWAWRRGTLTALRLPDRALWQTDACDRGAAPHQPAARPARPAGPEAVGGEHLRWGSGGEGIVDGVDVDASCGDQRLPIGDDPRFELGMSEQERAGASRSEPMPGHPQRVVVTPTGLVGERWNAQKRAVDRERVDDPIPWLRVEVALEGEVTLGALFQIVGAYPELMGFLAQYAWCGGLRAFHAAALEEAATPPERARQGRADARADAIVSLELYRLIAITPMGVESGVYVHGLGAPDADGVALPYSIGFTPPMDELAPLPLRLRMTSDIRDERPAAGGDSLGVLPARYTLLDLLDAIYLELSFHGQTPRGRDEAAARLLGEGDREQGAEQDRSRIGPEP